MDVSLVIPVKNEEESIEKLLKSISSQIKIPREVIIVDAGSSDKTTDIIRNYSDSRIGLKLAAIGDAYPGMARNAGVKEAAFEIIAFTDGGIELDKNWLEKLVGAMEAGAPCDVVYGAYMPRTDTLFKQCLALAVVPPRGRRTPFIASSLLKKAVWREIGGFPNLRAAEDRVFMEEIERRGFKTVYSPGALVIWDIPGDLKKVFNRFCNYSYHDLKAGRWRDWHLPLLKMYAAAGIFIFLGIFYLRPLLLVPVIGYMLRISKKIYINRKEAYFKFQLIPCYIVLTGLLIALIDFFMVCGTIRYMFKGVSNE